MLDQNTDRMWYVIGAVLVGAAIILIANGTMPEIFASVTSTFSNTVDNILYIDESYEAYGETKQIGSPRPDNRVDVTGVNTVPVGLGGVTISTSLHGIGEAQDRLYYDSMAKLWKVERHVGHYTLTGNEDIQKNGWGPPFSQDQNRRAQLYWINRNNVPNLKGPGEVFFTHAPWGNATPYEMTVSNISSIHNVLYFNVELDETSDVPHMKAWLSEHKPTITYILKNSTVQTLPKEDQQVLNEMMSKQ